MSAGSVNTPHILLNSGIGDSKTLSSLNIKPFHNLPAVGKNMSDTTVMYITWEVNSINGTFDFLLNNLTARDEAFAEWNATRTGRMANGVYNLSGLLRLNTSTPDGLAIRQQFGDPTAGPNAAEFEIIFIVCILFMVSEIHLNHPNRMAALTDQRTRATSACFSALYRHYPVSQLTPSVPRSELNKEQQVAAYL